MSKCTAWKNAKDTRKKVLGKMCEICGLREAKVGHHIKPRKFRRNTWENCQLRCNIDESYFHQHFSDGNSPLTNQISKTNNEKIRTHLGGAT